MCLQQWVTPTGGAVSSDRDLILEIEPETIKNDMSNSVCVLAQVSSLARLLYCSLTVVATPVFLSCVRTITRPILVPVRVNCWSHCSNDPAVPTGWDWLPYSEACGGGGGAEVFRSQNSHSPDWVLLDVWSLPRKTCPTVSRREGDWSGRCSRWLKETQVYVKKVIICLSHRRSAFKSTSWGTWLRKASRQIQVAKVTWIMFFAYICVFVIV